MAEKKALIAMSGGVDSSVAAYLAQKAGLTCIGATMRLFEAPGCDTGSAEDARKVSEKLGMSFCILDCRDSFRSQVMDHFVDAYECGLTPNPCIVCNRCLKFGSLLEYAKSIGCTYLVTGHYARISIHPQSGRWVLQKALDESKDQSYFLYSLTQEQLAHIRFPLGELTKSEAREIAQQQGFVNARKKDSQDICFVPDGDYFAFLQMYTGKTYASGAFLDLAGNVVGTHKGAVGYTLGQRKGLGIALGEPVYVCQKDMQRNTVTVGPNGALMHCSLQAKDWFWHTVDTLNAPMRVMAKARFRMEEQPATVYPEENGFARVEFDSPQRAITPGQAIVLYDGDTVVGGGTITEVW